MPDHAPIAERFLRAADDAASPEAQSSAAQVSIAASLIRIANQLAGTPPEPELYTGPVRVPPVPGARSDTSQYANEIAWPLPEVHPNALENPQEH